MSDLDKKYKVIVLMATYNGVKWISPQLDSIFNQLNVSVDIYIADDCSVDGTGVLVEKAFQSRVGCTFKSNSLPSGSAGANFKNLFIYANVDAYDFVALSDQDDIWFAEKLICAINCLKLYKADGYSCAVDSFWSDGRTKTLRQNSVMRSSDQLFEGAGQGCTFVLTTNFFKDVQTFCTSHSTYIKDMHYHDWLIYLLARAWNKKWYFDSTPMIGYRQHGGNEIGSRGSLKAVLRRLDLILSGWYLSQIVIASKIYIAAGGRNSVTLSLCDIFSQNLIDRRNVAGKLILASLILRHSRRKLFDRLIVMSGVLLGRI